MSIFTSSNYINYLENFDEEIEKRKFYEYLNGNNINLEDIFKADKKSDKNLKQMFNNILRGMKNEHNINIYECVRFIEEDFAEVSVILNLLDSENWSVIKKELSKKYNKKNKNEGFEKFFVFGE